MAHTTKSLSDRDANQTLQSSYNDIDASLTVNGFLTGKLGRKIVQTIFNTTTSGDSARFDFQEKQPDASYSSLYQLTLVYTDATQSILISAERTT